MAIERWEMEMRQRGNVVGADKAKVLRESYGDVPLTAPEEQTTLEIVRFTPEAQGKLIETGYAIHSLTGQSIQSLRNQGRPFWSTWHKDYPELEVMKSCLSEVAVNPDQLFLPDSNRKTLKEQEQMIKMFSRGLKINGVEAIMGEMPDYVDLAFTHLDRTGVRLFGEKYGYNYARTKTKTSESSVARVGYFGADDGLSVGRWAHDDGDDRVFASLLVVPA